MIDPEIFDQLSKWIAERVGKRFFVRLPEDGIKVHSYTNHLGKQVLIYWSESSDPDKLVEYLKAYIDKTHSISGLPQVEFSNDYSQFKIY